MQKYVVALFAVLLFVALVMLAVRAMKKRSENQSQALKLDEPDSLVGEEIAEAGCQYVSTVLSDSKLTRITASGLMHRGKARLSVLGDGLVIDRTGERSIAISSANLVSVERAQATIDRGTETNGLLAIAWTAGSMQLTTNLRLNREDDTSELFEIIKALSKKEIRA